MVGTWPHWSFLWSKYKGLHRSLNCGLGDLVSLMNLDDSDGDGFPAEGESDGWDDEALDIPLMPFEDGGVCDEPMFMPPSPSTPVVEATTPIRGGVNNLLPLQVESPDTSTSSTAPSSSSGRKRIRGKTAPLTSLPAPFVGDKELVFFSDPMSKSFRRLKQQDKRKWNKRLCVRFHRLTKSAKAGNPVSLIDGSIWTFADEDDFCNRSTQFRSAVYCAIAGSSDESAMLRGAAMQAWLNLNRTGQDSISDTVRTVKGQTALLTWQGPWGLLPTVGTNGPRDTNAIEELCARLQNTPEAIALFRDMEVLLQERQQSVHVLHYAMVLELCTKTFSEEGRVRVHLHAWLLFPGNHNHERSLEMFRFRGTLPFVSPYTCFSAGRGRGALFAGAFYVTVTKIGRILSCATKKPFEDYIVLDRWITTLFVLRKITSLTARELYLRVVTGARHNLATLDFVTSEEQQLRETADRLRLETVLRSQQRPFRRVPLVSQWLEQYEHDRDRYKFLVLDGPSQMGKTRFAASLTGQDKFLCLDCCSAVVPDMRRFSRAQHELVLFDEIHVRTVLACKKLFQASLDVVSLGSSPTNNLLYNVWCHRVRMICASNSWTTELNACEPADRAWLQANSVLVYVAEPLWE